MSSWTLFERHIYDEDGTRRCSIEYGGDEGPIIKWLADDGKVLHTTHVFGIEAQLIEALVAAKDVK